MLTIQKITKASLTVLLAASLAACASETAATTESTDSNAESVETVKTETQKIGIPDDATNGGRAIKLLETAGLIEVDPEAGWVPELKDITKYIYDIEIVPTTANTLPSTLEDFAASTINNTYALPFGLNPVTDGIVREDQGEAAEDGEKNPYINVIVAQTSEAENPDFKTIVDAYNTDYVAHFIWAQFEGSTVPAWDWTETELSNEEIVDEVLAYKSSSDGKTTYKVGVCGANNDAWNAVQKVLDDENAGIYIDVVQFDAYTIPNEALNSGEIDLNSFQHYAYLNNEIDQLGYELTVVGETSMAPLTLYSNKYDSIDDLKAAAGLKN